MLDKNTEKIHAELARQIRLAKKRLFKKHRAGVSLLDVGDEFIQEMCGVFNDLNREPSAAEVLGHEPPPPTYTHVTDPHENPVRLREDLASAVSEILTNDMAPPRLRDAVRDYVTDAPEQSSETLPNSPMAREIGGYRLLDDVERDYICEMLGDNSSGAYFTGLLIMLLRHLVATSLREGSPLEGEVIEIAEDLLRHDNDAMGRSVKDCVKRTATGMAQAIEELGLRTGGSA